MEEKLDPVFWYSDRELSFTPLHFTVGKTSITVESRLWILHNLQGRFSVIANAESIDFGHPLLTVNSLDGVPAFEDPKEAVLYELTWG